MNPTLKQYLPALGSVVVVLATVLAGALTDNRVTMPEAVVIAVATVNAVATYVVPNTTQWPWLKVVVTAVLSAFNALQGYLSDGLTANEWLLVLVAGVGATGVVAATNRMAPLHRDLDEAPPNTYGTDVSATPALRDERGVVDTNLIWIVVGVLAIIALVIYIF